MGSSRRIYGVGLAVALTVASLTGCAAGPAPGPDQGVDAGSSADWNDPNTFAGINNDLTGQDIKFVYSALYEVFGDSPPFDLKQFITVMSSLSQEDADFMVRAAQGSESLDKANSLLKINGLDFDPHYPVE